MKPEGELRQLQKNLRTIHQGIRGCRCRGCKRRRLYSKIMLELLELLEWTLDGSSDFDRTVEDIAKDAADLTVGGH